MLHYPLGIAQARFAELVRRVELTGTRVAVVSRGRPAAVLVAPADLAALEETAAVLSCPDTVAELRRAQAEVAAGRVLAADELRRPLLPPERGDSERASQGRARQNSTTELPGGPMSGPSTEQ